MNPVTLVAGLLATFAAITGAVVAGVGQGIDRGAMIALRTTEEPSRLVGPEWLPETARNLSATGSVTLLILVVTVATVCLFVSNKTAAAQRMVVAFLGAVVLLNLLKWGIGRARPDFVLSIGGVFTNSFPSGHAALSASTYFTVAAILMRMTPDRRLASFILIISLFLTFVAGISRIYLGLHYPSDVLAGWCLGFAWALSCGLILDWLSHRRTAFTAGATERTRNAE